MDKAIHYLIDTIKIGADDIIVVGCSGGPDSMALLEMLLSLRRRKGFKLICCHVNHNVRKESIQEQKFLEDYCVKCDVIFETMEILRYGDDNFHNEARTIRYHFFETIVKKYHATYLMTAHHGDDLIETILMRLTRGSTLKGYSGFSSLISMEGYKIVRPLIFYTKDELLEYDDVHHIPYVTDSSNFKSTYTRNRYRKVVLPFLKNEDKRVHEKYLKFSLMLQEYNDYIDREAKKSFLKVYSDGVFSISAYLLLDPLLQDRIVSYFLERIYQDDLILVNDKHINLVKDLIKSRRANSFVYLPNNIKVIKSYDNLSFVLEDNFIGSYEVELSDYVYLPSGGYIERLDDTSSHGNDICKLSSKEVSLPLHVRTRKFGDKIALKGMNGHKKLKEIFIDAKVPVLKRDMWPVVVDSVGNVVWVPGLKKTKFDKTKMEYYDIIYRYHERGGKK